MSKIRLDQSEDNDFPTGTQSNLFVDSLDGVMKHRKPDGSLVSLEDGGGGGGAVDSVFSRTGAVVAAIGDYVASQVNNDSSVAGTTVKDALDTLASASSPVTLNADDATQETLNLSGQEIQVNLATASTDGAMPAADKTKVDFITVAQAVDLDTMESDITANNAKVTNTDQNIFLNVASDSGTAVADNTTDTLTITGGTNVTTAVTGDTLTVNTSATVNSSDATLLSRANHTGTQTASTISDFDTEVSNNTSVTANTSKVTYPSADSTKVGFISVTQAVDLDTIESDTATNNAKVSASGSVTSHSDVTDAGSGAIITTTERDKLAGISYSVIERRTTSNVTLSGGNNIIAFTGVTTLPSQSDISVISTSRFGLDSIGLYEVSFKANMDKTNVLFGSNANMVAKCQLDSGSGFVDIDRSKTDATATNGAALRNPGTFTVTIEVTSANTFEIEFRVNASGGASHRLRADSMMTIKYVGTRA